MVLDFPTESAEIYIKCILWEGATLRLVPHTRLQFPVLWLCVFVPAQSGYKELIGTKVSREIWTVGIATCLVHK